MLTDQILKSSKIAFNESIVMLQMLFGYRHYGYRKCPTSLSIVIDGVSPECTICVDHLYDGLEIKEKVDLPTESFNIARSTIRQYSIQCGQSIILSIPHVSVKYIHFMSEAVFLIALTDSLICLYV